MENLSLLSHKSKLLVKVVYSKFNKADQYLENN